MQQMQANQIMQPYEVSEIWNRKQKITCIKLVLAEWKCEESCRSYAHASSVAHWPSSVELIRNTCPHVFVLVLLPLDEHLSKGRAITMTWWGRKIVFGKSELKYNLFIQAFECNIARLILDTSSREACTGHILINQQKICIWTC